MTIFTGGRVVALLRAMTVQEIRVDVVDPAQKGRAVVESRRYFSLGGAKAYMRRQRKIDNWNRYELVRK